ncbi:unannotated protein [freshwater metagenome]|uniref:Unannotated protein n=1 Tax=freshwater metagenome TaxID=449393 RepID=A0A6J6JE74_9ZZZZ
MKILERHILGFYAGKVNLMSILREQLRWAKRGFSVPAPGWVKRGCLTRHGFKDATWIETGTFWGETTNFLSKTAKRVVSIEPQPELFKKAQQRFAEVKNVEIINGLSEDVLPVLLRTVSGRVNFWLDGHYSAGPTHLGPQETPIVDELQAITDNIKNFEGVCVMIDDLRLFGNTASGLHDPAYPDIEVLVNWARANKLPWTIEQDIFIAKSVL